MMRSFLRAFNVSNGALASKRVHDISNSVKTIGSRSSLSCRSSPASVFANNHQQVRFFSRAKAGRPLPPIYRLDPDTTSPEEFQKQEREYAKKWGNSFARTQPGVVNVFNQQNEIALDYGNIYDFTKVVKELIGAKNYDVGLLFMTNDEMRHTNHQERGVDKPTDVLSFPVSDGGEGQLPDVPDLGSIYISPKYIYEYCYRTLRTVDSGNEEELETDLDVNSWFDEGSYTDINKMFEDRLRLVIVHSICHLLNYTHDTDDAWKRMVDLENKLLTKALAEPNLRDSKFLAMDLNDLGHQ